MIATIVLVATLAVFVIYSIKLLSNGYQYGLILLMLSLSSILLVLRPDLLLRIANFFGVGRGADLLLYLSFSLGLLLFLSLLVKIRRLERSITDLARFIALNNPKNQ